MDKLEIWEKYGLFDLFKDLELAERILSSLDSGSSWNFHSVEKFHKEFVELFGELKTDNVPDFKEICKWFAPSSTWDDFVGEEGIELGLRIYKRANYYDLNYR